jgi:DeoR family transcriptional regulator of aga operon
MPRSKDKNLAGNTEPQNNRRWAILKALQSNGYMSVADISQQFKISEVSIRRDLAHLEEIGLVDRDHGGAQAVLRRGQTPPFDARLMQNVDCKRVIGQVAASLIQPGDSIMLDAGTTVFEVARNLPASLIEDGNLTVVTRSMTIGANLRTHRKLRLILLGGVYIHDFDTFVGPQVEHALQSLHVNILFIGIDGISIQRGLTTDNVLELSLYPAMTRCADRVVVLSDSSKIGVNKLQTILRLDQFHTFITDDGAPQEFVSALHERGIEVIVVPN